MKIKGISIYSWFCIALENFVILKMFLLLRLNREIYAARNSIVGSERQKFEGSSEG
jgi:hypothetical protein